MIVRNCYNTTLLYNVYLFFDMFPDDFTVIFILICSSLTAVPNITTTYYVYKMFINSASSYTSHDMWPHYYYINQFVIRPVYTINIQRRRVGIANNSILVYMYYAI